MSLISALKIDKKKTVLKALSYAFSGLSIIFLEYILIDTFLHYPPETIGISP